jgi:hypothetical protein
LRGPFSLTKQNWNIAPTMGWTRRLRSTARRQPRQPKKRGNFDYTVDDSPQAKAQTTPDAPNSPFFFGRKRGAPQGTDSERNGFY